jgi:hypothetical protein
MDRCGQVFRLIPCRRGRIANRALPVIRMGILCVAYYCARKEDWLVLNLLCMVYLQKELKQDSTGGFLPLNRELISVGSQSGRLKTLY